MGAYNKVKSYANLSQACNQGGARGAFAPPTGPKGPHFDTQYPS